MKKKIIVKFNGGLGNQMFQYAFGYALAKNYSIKPTFDFSWFEDVKHHTLVVPRVFCLNVFNLDYDIVTDEDFKQVKRPEAPNKFKRTLMKHFPTLYGVNYYREKHTFVFDKKLTKAKNYMYYEGYFQHENYFKWIRRDILKLFSLKEPLDEKNQRLSDEIKAENSVSIHIRRGDYVTLAHANKTHGLCSLEYYQKAVDLICKKVKNPHFYIFSDDIKWVEENLKLDYPYTVVDFNQEKGWLDMELMKNCKHNIIANSSFSWWGAWLNQNPDKIVIAPKHWLAIKQNCDIVPKSWIKL